MKKLHTRTSAIETMHAAQLNRRAVLKACIAAGAGPDRSALREECALLFGGTELDGMGRLSRSPGQGIPGVSRRPPESG